MSLLDMILSGKHDKASYVKEIESLSFHEVFSPRITDCVPLKNKDRAEDCIKNSLFSIALFSLDTEFLEAVYDKFGQRVNYKTTIANKKSIYSYRSSYDEINIHQFFYDILDSSTTNYSSLFTEKSELLKSICLKYMNNYSYFISENKYYLDGTDSYGSMKKMDDILKYGIHLKSAPILIHQYFDAIKSSKVVLSYLYKRASHDEISYMINTFKEYRQLLSNNTNINIREIEEKANYIETNHAKDFYQYLHSRNALFDIVSGFTKKQENIVEGKIDYLLSKDKDNILKTAEKDARYLIGKSDISKIITEDKDKKYPMAYAILKNCHQIVNKLLDYGYKMNEEEISLLMANKVKDSLKEEYKNLLSSNIDELAILVKEFEKPLFKRLKTNVKNLKNFLEKLPQDKKEYLFSYYDQFQETHLSLYKSNTSSVDINDKNISAIDYSLFCKNVEQTMVLVEHKFPFNEEQIYKIGEMMFMFSSYYKSDFVDDYHTVQKNYINFLSELSPEMIKTILLKNSIKSITCGYDLMDVFNEYCVSKIELTKNEIDAMLNTDVFNPPLLDKILKDNKDYFFNKSATLNFIKSNVNNYDKIDGKRLKPEDRIPQTFQNILIYILTQDSHYMKKIKTIFGDDKSQEIWSKYERHQITSSVNKDEEEVDKVRIRRRI